MVIYLYFIYQTQYSKNISNLVLNNKKFDISTKTYLLDKPINEFYISTSHNSYIDSIQHLSIVNTSIIKKVLKLGARVIELDISHMNNIPIVAHGTKNFITTTYIKLENILQTILEYGFNTTDPLFIFCEVYNSDNSILLNNIINLFKNTFGNKLLLPNTLTNDTLNQNYLDYYYLNNFIADKPLKYFLNKVVLFGTIDEFNILPNIFYPPNNFFNKDDLSDTLNTTYTENKLTRIYKTGGLKSFLSFNTDFKPLWKKNYKLISMNFQMQDQLLYNYLQYFKNYSFIHVSEIEF